MGLTQQSVTPSAFAIRVIRILKKHGMTMDKDKVLRLLLREKKQHPAAVSMHLTKAMWKNEYFGATATDNSISLYLTDKGAKYASTIC